MQVPNINSIFKNLNERIMDNSVRSDLTKLDIDIKSNYFFFPFIIKTGLVNITDKGFQPNNGVPQNFTQMSQIFTGKEGIIAQWKNAIKIRSRAIPDIWNYDFFQNNKDWFTYSINEFKNSLTDKVSYLYITSTEKTYLWDATKQVFINKDNPDNNYPVNDIWEKINNENGFNVYVMNLQKIDKALDNFAIKRKFKGDAYKCHIVNINDTVEFSKLGGEEYFGEYNAWYLDRTITIETTYNFQREDFLRFYLVPLQSDKEDVDDNLLMFISNAQPKYNDLNELVYWVITFSYVKDYINTTGQTIQQFVQFSAPGEGYVIPKIIWDDLGIPKDYIINEKFTGDRGIKSIQISLLGNNAFSAPVIFGRPIENLGKWNEKVYPSRRLFIESIKTPISDPITKNSKPLSTYYLTNAIPAINGQYDNWLKRKQGQTNQEVKKNYEGYLNTDRDLTQATNPSNLTVKDKDWLFKNKDVINIEYDVRPNGYFRYNKKTGIVNINPSKHSKGTFKDMLNLFSIMNNHIISLPIDINESVVWTQRDIPVIGKFLNAITFGIPIYWKIIDTNTNLNYPNIKTGIPLFIGKSNYTFYDESYWPSVIIDNKETSKNQGNIPLDVFRYNTQDEVNDIINASSSNTSMAFTLTDKIKLHKYNKENGTSLGYQNVSSIYLGQYDYEDNNIVYLADGQFEAFSALSENFLTDINGYTYIIDAIGFYNIGKTACKIYMFTDDIDQFEPFSIMDYQISLQTTSLYNNSVRDWLTIYPLSYLDQFIDDNVIHEWPQTFPQPEPDLNLYPIEIDLSKLTVNLDIYANINDQEGKEKTYNVEYELYDFSKQGINNWQQVVKNYHSFYITNLNTSLPNNLNVYAKKSKSDDIVDVAKNDLSLANYIVLNDITTDGYAPLNYSFYKSDNVARVKILCKLLFYRDGVKLKVKFSVILNANIYHSALFGDIWGYLSMATNATTKITLKK
ncbi:hypothetical protein [Spiroplasma phoeniceum]|uniref:Adhesin P123 n=1 Tax=Spiroplasma phoeniceum P40 TaxID=1276259 RepID=A0A345DPA6_9MOLU|nr:hypothetical protein [Spiroplasma phoeniceum]AXF96044.1 putative adhesin P123 [Spiroplasma phoeniceum P40]